MKLPILYHEGHSGDLYSWEIYTEGNIIRQSYGKVDGKKSTTAKAVQGKNLGKKNETTPEQQAELEAKSMWQKKKDTKYSETKTKAKETVFLPMLAHDLKKNKKPLPFPVDVQPKLNGARAMAFWQDGQVKLMSRGGKDWNIPHIAKALEGVLPKEYVADGEIYCHDMMLQDIMHLTKHPELEEQKQLEFWVFDGFLRNQTDIMWSARYLDLEVCFNNPKLPLRIVPVETITHQDQLEKKLKQYEQAGFEGVIVRLLEGVYELGHRSRSLWKLKSFIDAEFEIVDFKEATGNDKGTVIWICRLPNGGTVDARPKGTREQRAKWFKEAKSYIGRQLTIRFQEWTKDGSLEFPVGVAIREPEDM